MKISIAFLSLILSSTAFATVKPQPPKPTPDTQEQRQDQNQGQYQGQGQDQGQHQSAESDQEQSQSIDSNQANSQSFTNNSVYKQKRQAPSVLLDSTNTTSECRFANGIGLSIPGGGISWSRANRDKDCRRFVLAQYLSNQGNKAAAERLLCSITEIKEALGEDCLALVNTVVVERPVTQRPIDPASAAAPSGSSEYATKEELHRAFKSSTSK